VTDAFKPQSDFLAALIERGFLHQGSDLAGLDAKAKSGDLVGYIGFDCTAKSLHVGNLLVARHLSGGRISLPQHPP